MQTARTGGLQQAQYDEILDLCRTAYRIDRFENYLTPLFRAYGDALHVTGRIDGTLVTHAMWITRWLQPDGCHPMETAYVEAVATHPDHQRQGFASLVMGRLVETIPAHYELAALSPATHGIYMRLGWQLWEGPLLVRSRGGEIKPTPEEEVMIMSLPATPELDISAPISVEWREGEIW